MQIALILLESLTWPEATVKIVFWLVVAFIAWVAFKD